MSPLILLALILLTPALFGYLTFRAIVGSNPHMGEFAIGLILAGFVTVATFIGMCVAFGAAALL